MSLCRYALPPAERGFSWPHHEILKKGGSYTYLGIQDACFHPCHALVFPKQLDLADFAELRQHCGEVGLQVNHVADAVAGSHQKCGGWLLLILSRDQGQPGRGWREVVRIQPACKGCCSLLPLPPSTELGPEPNILSSVGWVPPWV